MSEEVAQAPNGAASPPAPSDSDPPRSSASEPAQPGLGVIAAERNAQQERRAIAADERSARYRAAKLTPDQIKARLANATVDALHTKNGRRTASWLIWQLRLGPDPKLLIDAYVVAGMSMPVAMHTVIGHIVRGENLTSLLPKGGPVTLPTGDPEEGRHVQRLYRSCSSKTASVAQEIEWASNRILAPWPEINPGTVPSPGALALLRFAKHNEAEFRKCYHSRLIGARGAKGLVRITAGEDLGEAFGGMPSRFPTRFERSESDVEGLTSHVPHPTSDIEDTGWYDPKEHPAGGPENLCPFGDNGEGVDTT